jgi:hypothetical protein
VKSEIAAIAAFLHIEFMALKRFPPWAHLLVEVGQGLAVRFGISFWRHLFSPIRPDRSPWPGTVFSDLDENRPRLSVNARSA